VNELYLTILSRYPTLEELKTVKEYTDANRGKAGSEPVNDLVWALVNSSEFLCRH
jgi:hypothetical protein